MTKIKELRLAAGLTQRELAEKSGIPYRTIQSWEEGARRPSDLRKLHKVAVALGARIEDLIDLEESQ